MGSPFTARRSAAIRKDFVEYSGGFAPDEAADEVETYVRVNCPEWCTRQQLQEFFDAWAAERESSSERKMAARHEKAGRDEAAKRPVAAAVARKKDDVVKRAVELVDLWDRFAHDARFKARRDCTQRLAIAKMQLGAAVRNLKSGSPLPGSG